MKKLLILIVFIAVYLHFYPQPKFTHWLDQEKNRVISKVDKATDTKVRLKPSIILSDLKSKLDSFNKDEINQLEKITANRSSVESFYKNYCNTTKENSIFLPENVSKICYVIGNYQNLF